MFLSDCYVKDNVLIIPCNEKRNAKLIKGLLTPIIKLHKNIVKNLSREGKKVCIECFTDLQALELQKNLFSEDVMKKARGIVNSRRK